jgi:hypothetical protein
MPSHLKSLLETQGMPVAPGCATRKTRCEGHYWCQTIMTVAALTMIRLYGSLA